MAVVQDRATWTLVFPDSQLDPIVQTVAAAEENTTVSIALMAEGTQAVCLFLTDEAGNEGSTVCISLLLGASVCLPPLVVV